MYRHPYPNSLSFLNFFLSAANRPPLSAMFSPGLNFLLSLSDTLLDRAVQSPLVRAQFFLRFELSDC